MSNVTIDRAENVIVNRGGKAHATGWVVSGAHRINATRVLVKGAGGYNRSTGSYTTDTTGEPIPVALPLSVAGPQTQRARRNRQRPRRSPQRAPTSPGPDPSRNLDQARAQRAGQDV
jgi:hypothetical protein